MWEINGRLSEDIVKIGMAYYGVTDEELNEFITENEGSNQWDNQAAITDAINHYVRDWSSDGLHERIPTFTPILETIKEHFLDRATRKEEPIKVMIPGSGLGRLPHDVASLGNMEVTSNEYSYYMNLAYRYIETRTISNSVKFHPYLDWWSYQPTPAERVAKVTIPDVPVNASKVLMCEGDFMHIFDHETAHYDVVVTLFFIDTAKNSLDYIDNINRLLKPGGLWINLGPLLYGTNPTLQLSLEEMIQVSETMGFKFLDTDEKWGTISLPGKKVRSKDINYLVNARSIRKNVYVTQFWAAEKVHRNYEAFPKGENDPLRYATRTKF
jgi:SAM-dependent methyltransferase